MMNCWKYMVKSGIKSAILLKKLDSEPIHDEKYLKKAKTEFYEGKINTNFHNDKMPKKVLIVFAYQ